MKFVYAVVIACALGASPVVAQSNSRSVIAPGETAGQGQTQTIIVINQPPVYFRCPIFMRAQHLSDGSLVKTDNARPKGIGQRLHLTLMGPDSRQIASATVTVHGFTPKGRVMQASPNQGESSDAIRTLTVSFSAGVNRSASADVWVAGMTAVQEIDLNSVAYADGSTWKPADGLSCRVTPDPLMLITGR